MNLVEFKTARAAYGEEPIPVFVVPAEVSSVETIVDRANPNSSRITMKNGTTIDVNVRPLTVAQTLKDFW